MTKYPHPHDRPGIRGTQVKSSGNKNRMNPSKNSDEAYFSEIPMSWHVKPPCSLVATVCHRPIRQKGVE